MTASFKGGMNKKSVDDRENAAPVSMHVTDGDTGRPNPSSTSLWNRGVDETQREHEAATMKHISFKRRLINDATPMQQLEPNATKHV